MVAKLYKQMENLGLDDPCELDKETFTTKAFRLKAVGAPIKDKIIDTLAKEAETIYIPKKIKEDGDWLVSHKEKGQPLSAYTPQSQVIKWSNSKYNTVILYMLDNEVPEDMIGALKLYCDAFFTGCNIKIKKPGDEWDTGKHLPQDFITENTLR